MLTPARASEALSSPLLTVDDFFAMVGDALSSARATDVAQLWETPAFVVKDDGVRALSSVEDVASFWAGVVHADHERGMIELRAEVQEEHALGDRLISSTVRWSHVNVEGDEIAHEESTYVVRVGDSGGLRICAAVIGQTESRH